MALIAAKATRTLRPAIPITFMFFTIAALFYSISIQSLELMPVDSFELLVGGSEPPKGGEPMTPTHAQVPIHSEPNQAIPSDLAYPLTVLGLSSAKEAYERGFWQRMKPVPMDRWSAVSNATCLPHTTPLEDWKRRVPHVIMIGSQKGGTTALSYYLYSHPSIQYLPPKELNFFDDELDHNPTLLKNGSGIDAIRVLDYYQGTTIDGIVSLLKFQLEAKYVLDATPNYLFLSDRVPQRMLCATPWVKLLAVLRDPVDRAFSQYHMQYQRDLSHPESRRGSVSFEEYISLDMKVLQDTGILPRGYGGWHAVGDDEANAKNFDVSILTTEKLVNAWSTYTKLGVNSPVGRGLYSIQLSQWFRAMDSFGKPRSDLLIVPSRRLLNAPNETFTQIIEFLGLAPHSLTEYSRVHQTKYEDSEMQPEIQAKLRAFFQPFNRQLKELLLTDEWEDIWKHHNEL